MPVIACKARQIYDSRGNPTVEVDVTTSCGKCYTTLYKWKVPVLTLIFAGSSSVCIGQLYGEVLCYTLLFEGNLISNRYNLNHSTDRAGILPTASTH